MARSQSFTDQQIIAAARMVERTSGTINVGAIHRHLGAGSRQRVVNVLQEHGLLASRPLDEDATEPSSDDRTAERLQELRKRIARDTLELAALEAKIGTPLPQVTEDVRHLAHPAPDLEGPRPLTMSAANATDLDLATAAANDMVRLRAFEAGARRHINAPPKPAKTTRNPASHYPVRALEFLKEDDLATDGGRAPIRATTKAIVRTALILMDTRTHCAMSAHEIQACIPEAADYDVDHLRRFLYSRAIYGRGPLLTTAFKFGAISVSVFYPERWGEDFDASKDGARALTIVRWLRANAGVYQSREAAWAALPQQLRPFDKIKVSVHDLPEQPRKLGPKVELRLAVRAAEEVLRLSGRPMHYRDIHASIIDMEHIDPRRIYHCMSASEREEGPFVRIAPGIFSLR